MKTITLRVPVEEKSDFRRLLAQSLSCSPDDIAEFRIRKKSLDARRRRHFWDYAVEVYARGETQVPEFEPFRPVEWRGLAPIIIGSGPAGLFAAWTFIQHGIKPVIFERGERLYPRMRKISRYWRTGALDTDSNVCHGEGGAGTFSDGKLITRIKSPLIPRVMQALVDYGAPREITYVYNPHVGSNLIRTVIKNMSDDLARRGVESHFSRRVASLELMGRETQGVRLSDGSIARGTGVILACGHGAGDFIGVLREQGVGMEAKDFALGLRIEHPQSYINKWQLGCEVAPQELGAAQYKLTSWREKEQTGVYTFCMCPGGYVLSSTTDPGTIVVNGMSNSGRNSRWANSAVVVSIAKEKIPGDDPFRLARFQRDIERKTFAASASLGDAKRVPVQRLEDFIAGRMGKPTVGSSCPSGSVTTNLGEIFPDWITRYLREGLLDFEKHRRGFLHPEAVLHAVESRTSSPIRITRDETTMESVNTKGLFPCGEGAGYAGGITSSAVDGMRSALKWIEKFANPLHSFRHALA